MKLQSSGVSTTLQSSERASASGKTRRLSERCSRSPRRRGSGRRDRRSGRACAASARAGAGAPARSAARRRSPSLRSRAGPSPSRARPAAADDERRRGPRGRGRPCSSACRPSQTPTLDRRAPCRSRRSDSSSSSGGEGERERARPDRLERDRAQLAPLERTQRVGHLAGALDELRSAGELAVDGQRGLLAARPVERADPPALEPELEQLLERRGVLVRPTSPSVAAPTSAASRSR